MNDDSNLLILRDDRIIETVAKLQRRVSERFPDSGLCRLCQQLHEVARQSARRATAIGQPIGWIRMVGYALALILLAIVVGSVIYAVQTLGSEHANVAVKTTELPDNAAGADPPAITEPLAAELPAADDGQFGIAEFLQTLDSGLNDVIFVAIAIFFLVSLESRIKRRRALAAVHELRSIAHIIDMHQLTKDPERFLRDWSSTENSPQESMTPFELNRYLDYCSEMLSLTGKIAALYVQHFNDAAAVAAVSDVEQLTTGLSRKIWQKIMILEQSRYPIQACDQSDSHHSPVSPADSPTESLEA